MFLGPRTDSDPKISRGVEKAVHHKMGQRVVEELNPKKLNPKKHLVVDQKADP